MSVVTMWSLKNQWPNIATFSSLYRSTYPFEVEEWLVVDPAEQVSVYGMMYCNKNFWHFATSVHPNAKKKSYGVKISELERNSSFATDCAATVPCIFGASASPNKVAYSKWWVGCISHQLNTAMKNAMGAVKGTNVYVALVVLKKIITLFKKRFLSNEFSIGFRHFQKRPTRFGTTHDIAECLLNSEEHVNRV